MVVSQLRTDGRVLEAGRTDLGYIDAGQAFIRRSHIGDRRIPLDYNGDCYWLQEVLDCLRGWRGSPMSSPCTTQSLA